MSKSRFFLAALAAALLSTAAMAAPPTADQVSVPQTDRVHHGKFQAMFDSPNEFMMFRLQMHQATKDMTRDQKRAYRKEQIQKIRAMTDAQKASWRRDLEAQWNALPNARKARLAQRMDTQAQRHQSAGQGPQQDMDAPQ